VQPSWSPGGRRIAFWAVPEGGQRDILTIGVEGGEPRKVTDDPATDWNPVWSPDGRHLYFSSDRGGQMNLWRVPIDESSGEPTGEPEAITSGVTEAAYDISLSADGRRIAYISNVSRVSLETVEFDLAAARVTGTPEPVLGGSTAAVWVAVSVDGERLAWVSMGKQEDLYVSRTDGSGRRQLTDDGFKNRRPIWAVDGERIFFYSDRSGSYEIWSIRPDGSGLEQETDTPGHDTIYPAVSPDGLRLGYSWTMEGVGFVRDLLGESEPERLRPMAEGAPAVEPMSFSPDGRWIAGQISTRDDIGIVIYSLETGESRKLTGRGSAPRWLGDSRRLLFNNLGTIELLDIESLERHTILSLTPDRVFFNCELDEQNGRIYYTRISDEADVWLIELE
jgi:Tol biopolymer transport system component